MSYKKKICILDLGVGNFVSIKGRIEKSPVTYYPFIVHKQLDEWPEKQKRERHWALIEDVSKVVSREDYLSLINQFIALKPWIAK